MQQLRKQSGAICALIVLLVFVCVPMGAAMAEDPPPPPPEWNPEWPWDPYSFWNPDDELNPWSNPEYDPSTVPPHLWDQWWAMYEEWYTLNHEDEHLNCDVVIFEDWDLKVIVQNDDPDNDARRDLLREVTRAFVAHLVIDGTGDLHDAWVDGDVTGLEIDFFHPPEGGPSTTEVHSVVGAVMGEDANGDDMLLAYLYGYDDAGFDARREDVEDMLGHVMDEYRVGSEAIVADTRVRKGSNTARNTNHGTEGTTRTSKTDHNRSLFGVDKTDIEDRLGTGSLRRALLRVHVDTNPGGWGASGRNLAAHRLTEAWDEDRATWMCASDSNLANQSPDGTTWSMTGSSRCYDTTATATRTINNATSGWIELDVTDDVAAWLAGTASCEGWLLKLADESEGGSLRFHSRESTTGPAPQLLLEIKD